MTAAGRLDLNNQRGQLKPAGIHIAFAGVHDPHAKPDRYHEVAGTAEPGADLRVGVLYSPEPRVLDQCAADGYDLLLAGHTHGGQLCLPGYGTLVTNCGLDRERARTAPVPGRRAGVAPRLGRTGHVAVRARRVRLPPGSEPAHAGAAHHVTGAHTWNSQTGDPAPGLIKNTNPAIILAARSSAILTTRFYSSRRLSTRSIPPSGPAAAAIGRTGHPQSAPWTALGSLAAARGLTEVRCAGLLRYWRPLWPEPRCRSRRPAADRGSAAAGRQSGPADPVAA
jgi:hypothetical protein